MDEERFDTLLGAAERLIGCGFTVIDRNGGIKVRRGGCGFGCPGAVYGNCPHACLRAAYQADRFGGKYIYFCPGGFIFCISGIEGAEGALYLTAGPIIATSTEDHIPTDLSEPFRKEEETSDALYKYASEVPYFPTPNVTDLSELVFAIANHMSGSTYGKNRRDSEKLELQNRLNDYVRAAKSRMLSTPEPDLRYPYATEKKLMNAITSGSEADARKYLNEILGHIFYVSADSIESIKMRAMELNVLISRAAVDGGADPDEISAVNARFNSSFTSLNTIDEICEVLAHTLREFTRSTFDLSGVKHADVLSRATSYIRSNYMKKLTLDSTAKLIYISPSYLSRLFRDELNTTFNAYLNSVRIERSKILLSSEELSIAEVADLVGFFDQSYFNKVFKKMTGMTPKKYRESRGYTAAE